MVQMRAGIHVPHIHTCVYICYIHLYKYTYLCHHRYTVQAHHTPKRTGCLKKDQSYTTSSMTMDHAEDMNIPGCHTTKLCRCSDAPGPHWTCGEERVWMQKTSTKNASHLGWSVNSLAFMNTHTHTHQKKSVCTSGHVHERIYGCMNVALHECTSRYVKTIITLYAFKCVYITPTA